MTKSKAVLNVESERQWEKYFVTAAHRILNLLIKVKVNNTSSFEMLVSARDFLTQSGLVLTEQELKKK